MKEHERSQKFMCLETPQMTINTTKNQMQISKYTKNIKQLTKTETTRINGNHKNKGRTKR